MSGLPGIGPPTAAPSETEQVAAAAYSVNDFEEAARLYERAAERDPRSVQAFLGLARSYRALGQFNRAAQALEGARNLARRDNEVGIEAGNLALARMHPREAITHYDEVLGRDRGNIGALTGKAVALDFLSRHAEAQDVYRSALGRYPTNFVLQSNFALSQVLSGQIGAGLALMEELVRDPERGATVRGNMAIGYALSGRRRDARALLEGSMTPAEIAAQMAFLDDLHRQYREGRPIGYLVFG